MGDNRPWLGQWGWPSALQVSSDGNLVVDGVDVQELGQHYGTPLWVVSRATIEENFAAFRAAFEPHFANVEIAYSIKAHNSLAVIRLLANLGAKIDASAEYEFQLALKCGVPAGDVILNGNGKSDNALRTAAVLGARQVNVDSLAEVNRLDEIATNLGQRVRSCVRVQLTYERLLAQDPSYEATLRIGEGKYGSAISTGQAAAVARAIVESRSLDFVGLHHHVGFSGYMSDYTVDRELMHHRESVAELCDFANTLAYDLGVETKTLDLGGGFRGFGHVVLSTPGDGHDVAVHALPELEQYARVVAEAIESTLDASDEPVVQFETGGGQIANAVILLVTVAEVKDVPIQRARRYVVVDGSMMMFVSRGSMRVGFPVVPVGSALAPVDDVPVELVGQTCVYDSIAEEIRLPSVAAGEMLAILHQGAYCETESTQFNAFPRPMVVLVNEGTHHVIKRRETLADIHARDEIPVELWGTVG